MASILSVHRTPNRNDQFQIKFSDDGEKDHLTYRRESGKGLDVWVEGIDLCASECRKQVKDKKSAVEKKRNRLEANARNESEVDFTEWMAEFR